VEESDDRLFLRSAAKLAVRITSELGPCLRGTVLDVGLGGFFVVCTERLPVGTLCELEIDARGAGPIEATGRVAHVEPDGMGIQITELALEHYDELRRLVGCDDANV